MPKRKISNYLLMGRSVNAGLRYSSNDRKGKARWPRPTVAYRMKEFLTNNLIAWFVHNWRIKKRTNYPASAGNSIHPMTAKGRSSPLSICIAADWASATPQAAYIGRIMGRQAPDYTIHLGDTYYSGLAQELADNFGDGTTRNPEGLWPRGKAGSFALLGNHEMFSSGKDFFAMINTPSRRWGIYDPDKAEFAGQPAPFFCLVAEHWVILGLDTGYDSLQKRWIKRILNRHPNDLNMQIPDLQMQWLKQHPEIFDPKKGLVLLSHHQYASGFAGEDEFTGPAMQLKELLGDREVIWIWGHEHRFAMYHKYSGPDGKGITAHGRCIGHGGMLDEHLEDRQIDPQKAFSRKLKLYDERQADSFHFDKKTIRVGANGFARLTIEGDRLQITYWQAYWNGEGRTKEYEEAVFTEVWRPDGGTGGVVLVSEGDLTRDGGTGESALSYWPPA